MPIAEFLIPFVSSEEHLHKSHSFLFKDAGGMIVGPALETKHHYLVTFAAPRDYPIRELIVQVTSMEGMFVGLDPDDLTLAFTSATVHYLQGEKPHIVHGAYFTFSLTPKDTVASSPQHGK